MLHAEENSYPRRDAVVRAVEKASPVVVNISTEQIQEERYPFSSGTGDPLMNRFFEEFFNSFPPREFQVKSLGSGVIISRGGYILTNEHVISGASKISVRLQDKQTFPAMLIGSDPRSDLAVLKIKAGHDLPFIRMGRSDDLMIGETVIAIGNPFGLSNTVTTGVISAVNRSIRSGNRIYQDFIQTDASINPGNSGGPLLNIKGELIGINTAIYQKAEGIGFAIPINRARRIYEDLVAFGEVHKPWIGVFLQKLTPQIAQYFGISGETGLLVSKVIPGSPAESAGFHEGDVLMEIGGRAVTDRESYLTLLEAYKAGATVPMTLFREGSTRKIRVKSGRVTLQVALKISSQWLGLDVKRLAAGGKGEGMLIRKVDPHSEAYKIGIRPGDVIRQVNNIPISRMEDYRKAMEQAVNSGSVVLLIVRLGVGYSVTLVP